MWVDEPRVMDRGAVRVLLLEDSAIDAELLSGELQRLPRRYDVERVATRRDFETAVARGGFDIILADYSLPDFDGFTALGIAKARVPDVPFIFISGVVGEEFATDALKDGATDYVLKQRMNRLPTAVERALKEVEERRERRRAETLLTESRQRLQITFDSIDVGIVETTLDGRVLRANPAFTRMLGQPSDRLVGRSLDGLLAEGETTDDMLGAEAWRGTERRLRAEKRLAPLGRAPVSADVSVSAVRGGGGEPLYLIFTLTDITDRREAEAALATSEFRHRLAMEAGRLGTWDYHPETGELYWDKRCRDMFGIESDRPIAYDDFLAGCHPDDRERMDRAVARAVDPNGDRSIFADEFRTIVDGKVRWIGTRGQALFEGDRCVRFSGVVLDLTDLKVAEETMRSLNSSLEATVEQRTRERDRTWRLSRDLLTVCGADFELIAVNPAWTETLGWTEAELIGRRLDEHICDDDLAGVAAERDKFAEGAIDSHFECRCRHKDGSLRWIAWSAVSDEGVVYAAGRDITEEKVAQEHLRQVQKMETIGQLTGGVAHDFNNLLTVIVGNLELVLRHAGQTDETTHTRLKRAAENAMRGAERATALTQRLLAFARRQPLDPRAVDVNRLVAGMSDLFARTIGEHIAIETVLAAGLWATHIDPHQLETAILNLAVNARDAMPDGGRLTIETANAWLDEDGARPSAEVVAGQYVVVCVSDTGIGMSSDVLAQAFEPFFTTKDIGHGTGLGLSQVYGFVKQSGGHVRITSEPGDGTSVKLYLPRLASAGSPAEPKQHSGDAPRADSGETVLVVEDDPDVRAYSTGLLRELGYSVVDAPNGHAALSALREHPEIRLLFTDVGLPGGMNGRELAEAARALRPRLNVLFTTGYARNAIVHGGRLDPGVQLITKPFTYQNLATKVRDVLDTRQSPARILVVEDEALVRMIAVDTLMDAGFEVEEAATAAEAIAKMTSGTARFDAALLDLGLPDRKGDELARDLWAIHSDLPIIIASGYAPDDIRQRFAGAQHFDVIGKPYDSREMLRILEGFGVMPWPPEDPVG